MKSKLSYQVDDSFANERVFTIKMFLETQSQRTKSQDSNSTKENFMRNRKFFKSHPNEIDPSNQHIVLHTIFYMYLFCFLHQTLISKNKNGRSRRNGRITRRNFCTRWYCNWTQLFSSAKQLSYRLVVGKAERFSF